jgi:hypothetical protein
VGVGFDGEYLWVTAGDGGTGFCEFYIYDEYGELVAGPVHQEGGATGWGNRDLAYNGTHMFGSYDTKINGYSDWETFVDYFNGRISPNRAMAYNGTYFYTCGFSENLWQLDWDGNWQSTATATDLGGPWSGAYGLAYDSESDCLWMTTADRTGDIHQLDMDGTLIETFTSMNEYDLHGGCTMADTEQWGYVLVVLMQSSPDKLVFYDLGYGGGVSCYFVDPPTEVNVGDQPSVTTVYVNDTSEEVTFTGDYVVYFRGEEYIRFRHGAVTVGPNSESDPITSKSPRKVPRLAQNQDATVCNEGQAGGMDYSCCFDAHVNP